MRESVGNVYLQAVQTAAYCWMVHWLLWEHCKSYKEWLKQLLDRVREKRSQLRGRLAQDVNDALGNAGL